MTILRWKYEVKQGYTVWRTNWTERRETMTPTVFRQLELLCELFEIPLLHTP